MLTIKNLENYFYCFLSLKIKTFTSFYIFLKKNDAHL